MADVTALGELLIDFTPHGVSESGNVLFERNPGGAPANVLAMVSKLGGSTAFIGKVGEDDFGRFLSDNLRENGIDVSNIKYHREVHTTLAFVNLTPEGDRSFSFYRNPGADMTLEPAEIDEELIKNSSIFHFGSISMTDEPSRGATLRAIEVAKNAGVTVSYDPNLRPSLWRSLDEAKENILRGLRYADILKVSDEELGFITGESDLAKGSAILARQGVSAIFVTLGAKGSFYRIGEKTGLRSTYDTKVIDTTGAGDAFLGGVLYRVRDMSLPELQGLGDAEIAAIVDFANAAGALAATQKGAIPALPTFEAIDLCMRVTPRLDA